jgi:hypothetical protein
MESSLLEDVNIFFQEDLMIRKNSNMLFVISLYLLGRLVCGIASLIFSFNKVTLNKYVTRMSSDTHRFKSRRFFPRCEGT